MASRVARAVLAAILTCLIGLPWATIASASEVTDLQAQLDVANAKLQELGEQVMAAGEELNETRVKLDTTKGQIDETEQQIQVKQQELAENQAVLAERVADEYKNGTTLSLLSIILNSSTIEEFVSNVYYANKLNEQSVQTIDAVNQSRTELNEEKAQLESLETEQETLVQQQEQQVETLNAQQAEQQTYVDSLSDEVKRAIEEERQRQLEEQRRQAEAARQAAEQAARQLVEQNRQAQQQSQPTNPGNSGSSSNGGGSSSSGGSSTGSSGSYEAPNVGNSGGGLSASQRQAIIDAAYSQLGVPYVYGASSPGEAFDCSGFTMYCYSQAGISIPHSASSQGYSLTRVSRSELQPGDLLIWLGGMNQASGNHAGLYAGDGMMIHANYGGVELIPLSSWQRSFDVCGYIS